MSVREDAVARAREMLLTHRRCVVRAEESVFAALFVLEPATGDLLFRAPLASLRSEQVVLEIPEEGEGSLQVLPVVRGVGDERGEPPGAAAGDAAPAGAGVDEALIDRWRIVHGDPSAGSGRRDDGRRLEVYARAGIDTARVDGVVLEGELLAVTNPLAREEPMLCRRLNADRAGLARLAWVAAGVRAHEPVCVGVDPWGVHLRTALGVLRVEFGASAAGAGVVAGDVERVIGRLRGEAGES